MRRDGLLIDSSETPDCIGGSTLPLIERNAVARTFQLRDLAERSGAGHSAARRGSAGTRGRHRPGTPKHSSAERPCCSRTATKSYDQFRRVHRVGFVPETNREGKKAIDQHRY